MKRQLFAFATVLLLAAPAWGDWDDGQDAYDRGDYETAFEELLPYAKQGNAGAQVILGVMYNYGYGVPQDYSKAMKWYRLAAEQCHAGALVMLGGMYAQGFGVPVNYIQAYKLISLSSALGYQKASGALDLLVSFMTSEQIAEAQQQSAGVISACR